MKRSGPLQRRTPLNPGKPLERKPWKHDEAKAAARRPTRSQPIKARRDGPRRRRRDDPDHSMPWDEVRLMIYVRASGACELCGRQLNIHNMEGHHRRSRRVGPDCPCNALALCRDCHHGPEVHGNTDGTARELGRIVSKVADVEPVDVPVQLHVGLVSLTCAGTYLAG